jgi:hypothetical protein
MNRSGLIEVLRTLTPKELREFSEFVNSPFFNKNVNVTKLFELLRKAYPEFENEKIDKTRIFKKLFPGKVYKDSTMRLLMHYLSEAAEKFLAITNFTGNEFGYKETLAGELMNRRLLKDYEKVVEEHRKFLENVKYKDEMFFMNNFIYMYEHMTLLSTKYLTKYEKVFTKDNLESVTNNLTYYYLLRIFRFYAVAMNTMALFNLKIDTSLFDNLLTNFNEDSFREIPLIDIYYHIILCFLEPENENHFFEIKKLVIKNDGVIDSDTKIDIYINLENYCHRKYRTGNRKFLREGFEIYNLELERELHIERGFMSSQFYTSASITGCRLKEFDWVRSFLDKYKKDLPKELRESTYYYGLAFLEYELQNHEKALEHLAKVKGEDLYLKMDIRILQSKIYYSLVWNMPLQSLLDTFRKTVQNNKHMKEDRKGHYLKFIKYLHQINNARYKEDKTAIRELSIELEKEDYFPQKIWLGEELGKLSD